MSKEIWKKYLFWFANEHNEFRLPEIFSIISLFKLDVRWVHRHSDHPYCVLELPTEECAKKIASRSVTLRWCLELWSEAKTEQELHKNLKTYPPALMHPYLNSEKSFKIKVETFCNSQTQAEKVKKIESFNYLPIQGPVKLKSPDTVLQLIEYYGLDSNNIPKKPYHLFFGRLVAEGQRDLITKLSLKTRKFIGNTSMDPQLSLLMANQACVQLGHLVLDPFVGTGSLLVAAAQFGAYVLGTDIDYLMLHGKTRPSRIQKKKRDADESIQANMQQYGNGSQYIDVVVADASLPIWKSSLTLDAIITDPPYGIREATERIGSTRNYQISEEHLSTHIPSKIEYSLDQIYTDLLLFAAKHLRVGGRLVCWIPVVKSEYSESKLPGHPHLKLISNSEQSLSVYTSRRLLTYEKLTKVQLKIGEIDCDVSSSEEFRSKFFRYGEEVRKLRREQKEENRSRYTAKSETEVQENESKKSCEW